MPIGYVIAFVPFSVFYEYRLPILLEFNLDYIFYLKLQALQKLKFFYGQLVAHSRSRKLRMLP
jgi:hypothetical protein